MRPIQLIRAGTAFRVWPCDPPGAPGFWSPEMTWELETYEMLARCVSIGSTFFDVGAWQGPFTCWAMQRGAAVWAFEPDPVALEHLGSNLALNHGLVAPIAAALSSGRRRLRIYSHTWGSSQTSTRRASAATAPLSRIVPALTIDRFVRLTNEPPRCIKIDVQGGEADVLAGGMEVIVEHRPALVLSLHPPMLGARDWEQLDTVARIYGGERMPRGVGPFLLGGP